MIAIKNHVKGTVDINKDFYDYDVLMRNGQEIKIMVFIPRWCSPNGEYEPTWGPNIEGLKISLLDNLNLSEKEYCDCIEFAEYEALEQVKYTTKMFSSRYGANIEYGTYSDCTIEEFQQAVNAIHFADKTGTDVNSFKERGENSYEI